MPPSTRAAVRSAVSVLGIGSVLLILRLAPTLTIGWKALLAVVGLAFMVIAIIDHSRGTRVVSQRLVVQAVNVADVPYDLCVAYGLTCASAGDDARAEEAYLRATASPDPEIRAAGWLELGFHLIAVGKTGGADLALQRATEWRGTEPRARLGLGLLSVNSGEMEAARSHLGTLLSTDNDQRDPALALLGFAELEAGNYAAARRSLSACAASDHEMARRCARTVRLIDQRHPEILQDERNRLPDL